MFGKKIAAVLVILSMLSCGVRHDRDYKMVKKNLQEFKDAANYLIEKGYHKNFEETMPLSFVGNLGGKDTLLYSYQKVDTLLYNFQKKYHVRFYITKDNVSEFYLTTRRAIEMYIGYNFFCPNKGVIFDYSEKGIKYDSVYRNTIKLDDRIYFSKN